MAIIRSLIPLSSDPQIFTPTNVLGREKQLGRLLEIYERIEAGVPPVHVAITGPKSMGKTVTVHRFINETKAMGSKIPVTYVKCRSTLRTSITDAFPDADVPLARGSLIPYLAKKAGVPQMIFFDEFHNLNQDEASKQMKWLYDDYKCKITPVLIVNIPYGTLKKYFEEDTLSRMSWDLGNFINFPYYSFQEMYNILRQRAEEALEPDTWEPEAISQITKYGVEQNDLRRAIDILRDACTMFPDEHLITDHALAMIKQAGVYSISQDLDNLPLHARLYLLSLLMQETRFSHSTKGVPHSAVDNTFRDMCKNLEINQPSISTIWRLRKILETQEYLKRTTDRFIQYTPMGAKTPGSATYLTLNMESFVLINAFKKCEWSEFYDPEIGRKLTASL